MSTKILLSAAISLAIMSSQAQAAGTYFDARNDAMGGVGVASSKYGTASLVNPALLSKSEDGDDVTIILPSIGVQATDKDDAIGAIDDVVSAYDAIKNDNENPDVYRNLQDKLENAKGKSVNANLGVNAVIAIPNKYVNTAVFANGYGAVSVHTNIDERDFETLDFSISRLDPNSGSIDTGEIDSYNSLKSEARATAAAIQDYGLSFSKTLDVKGYPVHVGVSPKIQVVNTVNYAVAIEDFDEGDIKASEYINTTNGFNADLGVAVDAHNLTYGLSVRNIVPRSIDTKEVMGRTYTYEVKPLVTAGVAYRGNWATVAADIDMTETSGFTHVKASQFAGVGVEVDAWKWAQLRAGYRTDLKGDQPNMITAGVGISPFGAVHLDIAGMIGSDESVGAAASLSFTF